MKKLLLALLVLSTLWHEAPVFAQCATLSALNWDNLQFFPSAGIGTYTNLAQSQTQIFAIGTQRATFTHNYASGRAMGGNTTSNVTGTSYGQGENLEFRGDGTIGISFSTAVSNIRFSMYDIDAGQTVQVTAANGSTPVNVAMAKLSGTVLTVTGSNTANTQATATAGTDVAANNTDGALNIDIAGPVTAISIRVTTSGNGGCTTQGNKTTCTESGAFWLSDLYACTPGSFPVNYYQANYLQPFTGMPDYFITTPDNNSAYMLDPVTGRAKFLFQDASNTYINSFAYDGVNRVLYYISERSTADATNRTLKRYDFNNNTSTVVGDVTSLYGVPTFDQGVQSSGACFYDGAIYLGIEGGSSARSIVWRIDLKTTPVQTSQVYAMNSSSNGTSVHDWGDFIIKNGILYDFNTARSGTSPSFTYPNSSFVHYNMLSGAVTNYANLTPNAPYVGQAGMTWGGVLYSVRDVVERYNENGTKGSAVTITAVSGSNWVGSAGDASEPFRPRMDFGDAPASFEPDALSPAVHELEANLRLGNTIDVEWNKSATNNAYATADADGADEDGLISTIINTSATAYQAQVSVFNNTGNPASLIAWLDYNKNNIFDPSEGVSVTVASGTAAQTINLFWSGLPSTLSDGATAYLRLRLTSASNGMTTSRHTGYMPNGEVEDYVVTINKMVLAANGVTLKAKPQAGQVQLNWQVEGVSYQSYQVERSSNGSDWNEIAVVAASQSLPQQPASFRYVDANPGVNQVYYRLLLLSDAAGIKYSETVSVHIPYQQLFRVVPNPVTPSTHLWLHAPAAGPVSVVVYNLAGMPVLQSKFTLQKGTNTLSIIGLMQLPAGSYVVVVQNNDLKQSAFFTK